MRNKNILEYLPSRKIVYTVLAVLLFGAGLFLVFRYKNNKPKESSLLQAVGSVDYSQGKDTDGDELKDWEESLWGTDINNFDTDGDGYKDGEEIAAGYDPVDIYSNPATGRKASQGYNIGSENEVVKNFDKRNFSESVAMSFTDFFTGELGGASSDQEAFSQKIVSEIDNSAESFSKDLSISISTESLVSSKDNSPQSVEKYFSEIDKASLGRPYPQTKDADVFSQALQSDNFELVGKGAEYYNQLAYSLKKITVPSDFILVHKRLIEQFLVMGKTFAFIQNASVDPMGMIMAITKYDEVQKKIVSLLEDMSQMAKEHGAKI